MKKTFLGTQLILLLFVLGIIVYLRFDKKDESVPVYTIPQAEEIFEPPEREVLSIQEKGQENSELQTVTFKQVNFYELDSTYQFFAEIPEGWMVEYIPEIGSLNIYDPTTPGSSLEQSQIFIRFFLADQFLTLQTVDILEQKKLRISNRETIEYLIEKKPNVPNFANQPLWRSQRHVVTDIRALDTDTSVFYVIAQKPGIDEKIMENFFEDMIFLTAGNPFVSPISRFTERGTKKPFGIFIDPETSPVQPEIFRGYHTGLDLEIFEGEEGQDVHFFAFCSGVVKQKTVVDGYGGLLVQECEYNKQVVQVVYGHIRLSSVDFSLGEFIPAGKKIGVLGTGFSRETSGERKHLHLGVVKGNQVDLRGYVNNKEELSNWIDPLTLLQ